MIDWLTRALFADAAQAPRQWRDPETDLVTPAAEVRRLGRQRLPASRPSATVIHLETWLSERGSSLRRRLPAIR